jgi:hypothetical protein
MSTLLSSYNASNDAQWRPWARTDQIFLIGDDAAFAGPQVAHELGAFAGAALNRVGDSQGHPIWAQLVYSADGHVPNLGPDEHDCASCLLADRLVIGDDELLRAVGAEAGMDALAAGQALILMSQPVAVSEALFQSAVDEGPTRSQRIPVKSVSLGVDPTMGPLPMAVLPPAMAADLGLAPSGFANEYLMRLERPVTELDVARAGLLVGDLPNTWADAPLGPARPDFAPRLSITLASFLFALGVVAIAVALGESESHADHRTLLALGADPGVRRRIIAARAGVLALMAGLLAVPAGLLPAWGLLASRDTPLVVPVAEVGAAVLILPLVAIAGALLLSRSIPPWSAFRDVAHD